jgi:hypothetical protein
MEACGKAMGGHKTASSGTGGKHEGWTEDVKMAFGQVFDQEVMCYRSREVKNGLTEHREQKRGWSEDEKMASGKVFGHGIMCYRSREVKK